MARRKVTKNTEKTLPFWQALGEAFDSAGLPDLTAQQMAFVECLLAGKSASDAYRTAYAAKKMTSRTIWANASRLRYHSGVAAWLTAARMANLSSATLTLEQHIQELDRLKEIAIATGNVGAAVQAEQLRGKAAGHYVEKFENVTKPDPVKTLDEIAKISPELAIQLAKEQGVNWQPTQQITRH